MKSEYKLKDDNYSQKTRFSNLELYRILLMLIIIAHHYVVNSGITQLYNFDQPSKQMIFMQLFGFGGKMAISGFTLITGYFMCQKEWSSDRLLKLLLPIKIYTVGSYLIFLVIGYTSFCWEDLITCLFSISIGSDTNYISVVVWLYLLIPFINILIRGMNQNQHKTLLILLFIYFTVISTIIPRTDTFSLLGWMIAVYLGGAYVKLYSPKCLEGTGKWLCITIVMWLLSWTSIIAIDFFGADVGYKGWSYYFVIDCNKICAIGLALSSFVFFRNLKMPYIATINKVASATFGVLLIHANSNLMRQFLWRDFLKCTYFYSTEYVYVHAIFSVVGIFIIATGIELCRLKIVDDPLFKYLRGKRK